MWKPILRRDFLKLAGAAGVAAGASQGAETPVRIGIIGVGNRGTSLLRTLLDIEGVEIPALCDINEANLARGQGIVEKAARQRPEGYGSGVEDFRRLIDRKDLDGVVVATPWEWHTPAALAAMKAGKYAGVEVPAGVSLEECWQLVNTSEKTGVPCMMLENVCYFRNVLMILNMVRQGVLGELLHCEAGYQHDVRRMQFTPDGGLSWRGVWASKRNANLYPTHPIGPVAWWMNINRGDRFAYLTSMSTRSRGPQLWASQHFGADNTAAKHGFALGDINTTLIQTANGQTVTLYYDTQSPRPYDLIFRVQGTGGIYSGTLEKIYVDGVGKTDAWDDPAKYYERYEHPLWKTLGATAQRYGHGGGDYITLHEFVKAVRRKSQTPVDVYDSATWSAIIALSEQSVAGRSRPVDFPDFTRGKWKTAKPVEVTEA